MKINPEDITTIGYSFFVICGLIALMGILIAFFDKKNKLRERRKKKK